MKYLLRFTLQQSKDYGRTAAILLNLIGDMEDGVSTRNLCLHSGLSVQSVTTALRKLRVLKVVHPNELKLTELGVECSKISTLCSKIRTPSQSPESPVNIEESAKEGGAVKGEGGTIGGLGIESSNLENSNSSSTNLTRGGKEINQLGGEKNLEKTKKAPTLQQVLDFFEEKNQPQHKGRQMWSYYNRLMTESGGRVWKDGNGRTIQSWKRKAIAVWFEKDKEQKQDRYAGWS